MKNWLSGLLISAVVTVRAEIVLTKPVYDSGGTIGLFTTSAGYLGTGLDYSAPWNFLFDQMPFGTEDIGKTFAINSSSDDPDFDSLVATLTNGQDDFIFTALLFGPGVGQAEGYYESQLFMDVSRKAPDLSGYSIQRFEMTINDFWFQSPGRNPNGDGFWTDSRGAVTFRIDAVPVPEPGAVLIFGLSAWIAFVSRTSFKRPKPCTNNFWGVRLVP